MHLDCESLRAKEVTALSQIQQASVQALDRQLTIK